jgi:SH3 domain-containing YSC84-like protein 1
MKERNQLLSRAAILTLIAATELGLSLCSVRAQKGNHAVPAKAVERSKKAAELLDSAMAKPSERIPAALLTKTAAVAVFPEVKKAGLLIEGVASGRGVITRRLSNGKWSVPVHIHLGAISIGPQLNASSFAVIMLFMNDKAADWFVNNEGVFFDRDKAPVAGPVGEIKTAEKEVVPVADVFSYLFDDGQLQGKDLKNLFKNFGISFDNDLNKACYGLKAADVLSDHEGSKVPNVPDELIVFSQTVARYFPAH